MAQAKYNDTYTLKVHTSSYIIYSPTKDTHTHTQTNTLMVPIL